MVCMDREQRGFLIVLSTVWIGGYSLLAVVFAIQMFKGPFIPYSATFGLSVFGVLCGLRFFWKKRLFFMDGDTDD